MRLVKILDTDNVTVYLNPLKVNTIQLPTDEKSGHDLMKIMMDSQSAIWTTD